MATPKRRRPAVPAAIPPTDLAVDWVPIDQVQPYPGNPRTHHDIVGIANSLRTFGWQQPLVVDEAHVLIVGHGRYQAALGIQATTVPIHVARNLTPAQVAAYRLADNKSAEGSGWDEPKLILELQGLRESGDEELISLAGFDLKAALDQADAGEEPAGDTEPQFTEGLVYRVVVDCADEQDQAALIERLEGEGRGCRALIS
jgi:hypothetical protein